MAYDKEYTGFLKIRLMLSLSFGYHLVDVISLSWTQSDHIEQLLLYLLEIKYSRPGAPNLFHPLSPLTEN
jgi:hypothetical protein